MGSIYFNGSELTGQHDVKFNGTDMDNVYLNGSKLWTRHPYAPGTHLITFSWGFNNTFSGLITTHWNTYGTVMFKQQPYTHSGTILYSGNSVSGATGFSISGSGNGGSTIKIGYSGT